MTSPSRVILMFVRLQVAVNDAALVGVVERVGNLTGEPQRLVLRQAGVDAIAQRLAFDELQDDAADAGILDDAVDRRDVGVAERRQQPRLALEPRDRSALPAISGGRILMATSRPSRGSWAR